MPQTIRLRLTYTCYSSDEVTLPDGLTWDDVTDWWVKWNDLHLQTADGTVHTVAFDVSEQEPDMKRPSSAEIWTDDDETLLAES